MVASEIGWEHFPHGADVGIRGWGHTPAQAFEQAALALTAIAGDPAAVKHDTLVYIVCDAPTLEDLLVDWLNAIIFEMARLQMLFGGFEVQIANHHLSAMARGERVDPARHEPGIEPKGATYTALHVGRTADARWEAQCIVDV